MPLDMPVEFRTDQRRHRGYYQQLYRVRWRRRRIIGPGLQTAHASNAFNIALEKLIVVSGYCTEAGAQQGWGTQFSIVQTL